MKLNFTCRSCLGWMGTDRYVNSSNSIKVKFVKVVNRCGVAHIVNESFQTPTIRSIDCFNPFSISCELKKSWELETITMQWKITMSSWSTYFDISSLLEIKVKSSILEEEAWLSLEEDIFGLK